MYISTVSGDHISSEMNCVDHFERWAVVDVYLSFILRSLTSQGGGRGRGTEEDGGGGGREEGGGGEREGGWGLRDEAEG